MKKSTIAVSCADNQVLAASLFEPAQSNGLSLQINGATGVPRRYYEAFATFMAEQGFTVMTFDFRGIGESPQTSNAPAPRMLDWGRQDCTAVQAWLKQWHPKLTHTLIGHSFGGQVIGLMPQAGEIAAAIGIAAQHGYWRNWSFKHQLRLLLMWYGIVPAVLVLRGHLPGRLLGGEALPAGVARDWSRWCRSPDYLVNDDGMPLRPYNHLMRAPLRMISFADDTDTGPKKGVDRLMDYYPNAAIDRQHIAPQDWGVAKIGHFGFFRRNMPQQVWATQAAWLYENAQKVRAAA